MESWFTTVKTDKNQNNFDVHVANKLATSKQPTNHFTVCNPICLLVCIFDTLCKTSPQKKKWFSHNKPVVTSLWLIHCSLICWLWFHLVSLAFNRSHKSVFHKTSHVFLWMNDYYTAFHCKLNSAIHDRA